MVDVQVKTSKEKIVFLSAKGHADYAPHGRDIVCSAISAVLAGGFNALDGKHELVVEAGNTSYKQGEKLSRHDQCVLDTILIQLLSIQETYPENIKVTINEI